MLAANVAAEKQVKTDLDSVLMPCCWTVLTPLLEGRMPSWFWLAVWLALPHMCPLIFVGRCPSHFCLFVRVEACHGALLLLGALKRANSVSAWCSRAFRNERAARIFLKRSSALGHSGDPSMRELQGDHYSMLSVQLVPPDW